VAWGWNGDGQCNVASPNADFVAIAGGGYHSLGLKSDGTIVAWGYNYGGQCNVPAPNADFVAVAGGSYHSLGLKSLTTVPTFISFFDAGAAGTSVDLMWDIISDEDVLGFKIYRGAGGAETTDDITAGQLIARDARTYRDESISGGMTYEYTLAVVLSDRSEVRSQTVTVKTKTYVVELSQNSPNPFNPTTTISFTLPERARVTLSIYDVQGELLTTIVDEVLGEGHQERFWDGKDAGGNPVGSGVYFYRLTAGDKTLTKKMVLLK